MVALWASPTNTRPQKGDPVNDGLVINLLSVVPKRQTARLMGASARLRLPRWMNRMLMRWFVRKYGVNMEECVGDIEDFPTLSEFFVRELKPGVRPIDPDPRVLVSPVDGRVHTFGRIQEGRFVQVDGQTASVAELLGVGDPRAPASSVDSDRFENGHFAILYLSPKDYHRVHTPAASRVRSYRYLPGKLWPVFPAATRRIEGLFCRNERLVFMLETDLGSIAEVMVGAFGVGRMTTTVSPLVTNTGGKAEDVVLEPCTDIERAGEIGRFHLGSTVILLLEPERIEWLLRPGQVIQLGEAIGQAPSEVSP
jgi:phosphatidylserine decarboxylase